MDDFFDKWKSDKRFQALVKLCIYVFFVLVVSIYAFSIKGDSTLNVSNITGESSETLKTDNKNENHIDIPDSYKYTIDITIDDKQYQYTGQKQGNEEIIKKGEKEYLYRDNTYYYKDGENYLKVNKEEVYDVINQNYIDLDNINTYLSKATQNGDQYIIYLKDIVLGADSDEYFTIIKNDNNLDINYTPLMKLFNNNINNYKVKINIEEYKEVN